MKNEVLILIVILAFLVLFSVMCWAHRDAGTALLATFFAPLVIVPIGSLVFLVLGAVLKGFNVIFRYVELPMSENTIVWIAGVITGMATLWGLFHYVRDQRPLSKVETGPRWGGARVDPNPTLNQRKFMRK